MHDIIFIEFSDYIDGDQTILFTEAGQECVNITIVQDDVFENTERFTVILNSVDKAAHINEMLRMAVINILNSGGMTLYYTSTESHLVFTATFSLIVLTIGFSQSEYEVNEENEFGQGSILSVCLEADGTTARDVVVTLTASDGTAIGTILFLF